MTRLLNQHSGCLLQLLHNHLNIMLTQYLYIAFGLETQHQQISKNWQTIPTAVRFCCQIENLCLRTSHNINC